MKTIANKLRALREQSGLSVEALATKAGLSRASVHHLEAGTRKPSLETIKKICKALGVSLSCFD